MRLLLDSHTVIWAVDNPGQLGRQAATAIQDPANELFLSAGPLWELSIKVGLGKLSLTLPYRQWMLQAIADLDLAILPITVEHADVQATLPAHHRDPFDRLLAAQAKVEQLTVVSSDAVFEKYGVLRLW